MKKYIIIILIIIVLITIVWSIGQKIYLSKIETLNYEVLEQKKDYQIRLYSSYNVASTTMKKGSDGDGFMNVAGYIFGDNTKNNKSENVAMTTPVLVSSGRSSSQEIAMTSPVIVKEDRGGDAIETMSFVLPAEYTLETLPIPNNQKVSLSEVKESRWAVLQYTWSRSEKLRKQKLQKLLELLEKDKVETTGEHQFAFYDPPTTLPFLLKNEV
jgi:hypothetical protein